MTSSPASPFRYVKIIVTYESLTNQDASKICREEKYTKNTILINNNNNNNKYSELSHSKLKIIIQTNGKYYEIY